MLQNLHVKNLALIDEAEVNFKDGLNILTGETGAGKSVIIGSVNLALGEKVSKSMIREGADYALVELVFQVDIPAQTEQLCEMDIFPEDGMLIMSRKVMASGRSICRINSETVPVAMMRRAASVLIDIHGQHEHQSLLTKKNHMKYLDSFARKELDPEKEQLKCVYRSYAECKRELEEASADQAQRERELSFLEYEIQEIEEASLQPGEDEELEADFRRLSNGRKILEAAYECSELCSEGSGNAAENIGRAVRALLSVAHYDDAVSNLADQLQELDSLLSDFNRDLSSYLSDVDFSDEKFQMIEERLDLINHLKSKYGKTVEQILAAKKEKEQRAEILRNFDEYKLSLEQKLAGLETELSTRSGKVTEIRKKWAAILTDQTRKALIDLNFLDVRFEMEFSRLDHYTETGWDEAVFLISTNPGEPLKPLDAVASGGELSRIMLALKTVLAEKDDIETLIFDEIDSGISGRTAQAVAEKIKMTGTSHQVICITHLPQIAAMADAHYLIEKTSDHHSTISRIRPLDREESISELARMLGGVKITETVLQNAREMKELAEKVSEKSI